MSRNCLSDNPHFTSSSTLPDASVSLNMANTLPSLTQNNSMSHSELAIYGVAALSIAMLAYRHVRVVNATVNTVAKAGQATFGLFKNIVIAALNDKPAVSNTSRPRV